MQSLKHFVLGHFRRHRLGVHQQIPSGMYWFQNRKRSHEAQGCQTTKNVLFRRRQKVFHSRFVSYFQFGLNNDFLQYEK